MDKLASIKIKQNDGTYSDPIPVSVLGKNVECNNNSLIDILGNIDIQEKGNIQYQLNQLFNTKVSVSELNNYVYNNLEQTVTNWLENNIESGDGSIVIDKSLSIEGAAADAKATTDTFYTKTEMNQVIAATTGDIRWQIPQGTHSTYPITIQGNRIIINGTVNVSSLARTVIYGTTILVATQAPTYATYPHIYLNPITSFIPGHKIKAKITLISGEYEFTGKYKNFYIDLRNIENGNASTNLWLFSDGEEMVIDFQPQMVVFGIPKGEYNNVIIEFSMIDMDAIDKTLSIKNKPADAKVVGNLINSLNNSLTFVFSTEELSFTKYLNVDIDIPAGNYIINIDNIVSEDNNNETSLISFYYADGNGNVSIQCNRNTKVQQEIVFEKAISRFYIYSSINASASDGHRATWYGISINKIMSDKTLSISNHFADAGATGEKFKETEDAVGTHLVEWVDGYYINTNQEIGEEVPMTLVSTAGYRCAIVDCGEGDVFYLDGLVGGNSPKLRIFVDENNVKLTTCANNLHSTTEIVTAPEGAAKLVLNDAGMVGVAYKGIPPFYYKDIISKEESDRLNVGFSVYGGVSHPSFVHGSMAKDANGYVHNTQYNSRCSQNVYKPFSAAAGDMLNIKSGYQYLASKAMIDTNGTKTSNITGWTSNKTVIKENGLYIAVVQKEGGGVMHPNEAQEAFYVIHNGGKAESKSGFTLSINPYRNLAWSVLHDVTSVTHAHCTEQTHFDTLRSKYKHLAISNYHPSVPYYPLETYFEDASGILASPNAEHAYFTGSSTHVHLNSVGSFLMSDTDSKYDGTVLDMICDTLSTLKMQSGGGVTINHPKWSGLSKDQIIPMIVTGGVIAIEIYNASCELSNNTGYALDIWDAILSEGVQVYGVAVPDHEAQYRPAENRQPFGYNHVLVVNETEDEILSAYRLGHFYTTLLNDGLTLSNVNLSSTGLYSIEVSEASTFTFTTATRSVAISEASTSADFQTEEGDIYVRAEVMRGNNKLWTNAIML